ncbi:MULTISPECIES: alpha-ketoglutarate-dependent dioxygenase AlkB [unclassified Marinobacterium]|uniref:alpha-ketoglutarate-dependent dioxygenase AlkB family protein n=1 Tax=unclassified Marinobacterium TaxID=2644139 RepID=UPI001568CA14|nr:MULTISPECIES: alpha-ketoglutarate-dependent dioxygenase AlkB [unclassified Marinobacterium]NRP58246.1 2OG-Fe(II) oxygenase superfamily protein [Marinobacterium sp. xm-d-510]NRP97402.1 2OG-Fe(II) oxygenase superfamily protein [Marinobacterium sp. xm-a-127]
MKSRLNVELIEDFLTACEADELLTELTNTLEWCQESITLYGKSHSIPRLQCFVASKGVRYRYSNLTMEGSGFPNIIESIKDKIESTANHSFNAVLCNLYRDGHDSMGWHSDNEPELGEQPVIASLSLGSTRTFRFRDLKSRKENVDFELSHGSLLIMNTGVQECWEHSVPKRLRVKQPRINLTFRRIDPAR